MVDWWYHVALGLPLAAMSPIPPRVIATLRSPCAMLRIRRGLFSFPKPVGAGAGGRFSMKSCRRPLPLRPTASLGRRWGPERIIPRQPQTSQTAPPDATRDRYDMEGRMEPFPAAVAAQPNQRPNYGSSGARGWTRSLQSGASKCVCRLRRLRGAGRGVLDTTRASGG